MNEFLRIEKMTADDIGIVYALYLSDIDDDPNRYEINWLSETIDDPYGYLFVAYWGDELAGYCGGYHNTPISNPEIQIPDYFKIGQITVKKSFRRKGIGKSLMLKMLDTARELGLGRIKLEVSIKNEGAIKLYESFGFKIEQTEVHFYDDGDDAYIMWRYSDA